MRARLADVVLDRHGNPVAGATIEVFQEGTTTPITETIYAAASGVGTLSNPFTTGNEGEFVFYLDAVKRVDLRVSKAGLVTETHTVDVLSADPAVGGTGAPTGADYLVGTAHPDLTAEIVVGGTPGGELGGTWGSPTVDSVHSGSAHHAQSHDHSGAGDGTTLTPATLNIPSATGPAQTAEGQAIWDSDDNRLTVGDGASRKTLMNQGDAAAGELSGTYPNPTVAGTHAGSAHHGQSHDHSAAGDGTTLSPATLNIPSATAPAQTAEGQAVWDSDDNKLTVGDGTSRKTLLNEGAAAGGELSGTYPSPTVAATHSGSAHHSQSHDHSAAGDGTSLSPATLDIPSATAPAQTAEGRAVWDSDDDRLTIGDGAARKSLMNQGDAAGGELAGTYPNPTVAATHAGSAHHARSHGVTSGDDHSHSGGSAGRFMRETGAAAFAFEAIAFSRGGTMLDPVAKNIIVWRAPFACTVTNVRGYRVGGTGATVNARKNGTLNHLAADLSLTSADSWMDGGAVQNAAYAAGDKLEIMVVSVAGTPTQVAIQLDYTRP